MQSLRSAGLRRLCLSLTASVTRTSRNPPLSVLFYHTRSFAPASPRWGSGVRQFSHQTKEDGEGEEPSTLEAISSAPTEDSTNTLYVGNLPYSATEGDLHETFSAYGSINRLVIGRRDDGRSLGYAHIEFITKPSATKAYKEHEDCPVTIEGRQIRMDYALPRNPNSSQRRVDRDPKNPCPTLFIGNLHHETKEEDIFEALKPLGSVVAVRIARRGDTFKGFAHIDFENTDEAERVLEHHQRDPIHVLDWKVILDRASPAATAYPPSPRLYFTGWDGDESSLRSHFRALRSKIMDIGFLRNPNSNASTRSGFVRFRDIANAKEALARFNGPKLTLAYSRPENPSKPKPRSANRWEGGERGGHRFGLQKRYERDVDE